MGACCQTSSYRCATSGERVYGHSRWSGKLNAAADTIVQGRYVAQLAEYSLPKYTIGRGRKIASVLLPTIPPSVEDGQIGVMNGDIGKALQTAITNGVLPQPNANSLYFVFLPDGTTYFDPTSGGNGCGHILGYHDTFPPGSVLGITYAVTSTCSAARLNLFPGDNRTSLTNSFSHELVEAICDPNPEPRSAGWPEIADPCDQVMSYQYSGYWVTHYWSDAGNTCVWTPTVRPPLYRMFNTKNGDHFYTPFVPEMNNALDNLPYVYEGIAAYIDPAASPGTVPLFRLWQKSSGDHFYTTSAAERDNAIKQDGYVLEVSPGYVSPVPAPETTPLYRLFQASSHDHLYTTSAYERDQAIAQDHYVSEDIACYVLTQD